MPKISFTRKIRTIAAIKAYYDIYRQYPDLDIAPKSLYVAAWLSDNVLQKNQTAKTLYEKVCEKYPQSIYCTREAQPKIKIVQDTLEALQAARKEMELQKAKLTNAEKNKKTPQSSTSDSLKSEPILDESSSQAQDSFDVQSDSLADAIKDSVAVDKTQPVQPSKERNAAPETQAVVPSTSPKKPPVLQEP